MKQTTMKSRVDWYFKDKQGKWAIIQFPNVLLSIWIVLLLINLFVHDEHLAQFQNAALFAWAYVELTTGSSIFRKVFGAVILVVVAVGFFM